MLRTTLIRGGLITVLACALAALWTALHYVRPEAVRATVLESFSEQFPDAHVNVGEAHLRVFGGVSVRDLSLARDGEAAPFFAAPSAIIAHDKEELSNGRMVIRKIELDGATLRLERRADGRWSFEGLSRPSPADRPMPMFVVSHGTIVLKDKSPVGIPPATFTEANFVLINDPPPLHLNVKGSAMMSVAAKGLALAPLRVEFSGRLHRLTGEFTFRVNAGDVPIGPELTELLKHWQPKLGESLTALTANAGVKAEISYKPDAQQQFVLDLEVKVRDGRISDPALPLPVEHLAGTLHYRDGRFRVEKATARIGASTAELSFESRPMASVKPVPVPPPSSGLVPGILASTVRKPAEPDAFEELEQHLEKLDLTLRDFAINDDILNRLGGKAESIRKRFAPAGVAAVSYRFTRPSNGGWRRELELKPARFGFTYEKFLYPLQDVTGIVRKTATHTGSDDTLIDLSGSISGSRIDIKGTVSGSDPDPAIDLRISGNNVAIDDRFFEALPKVKHQDALKKLRARGRADIVAEVKQDLNVNRTDSVFKFSVSDGSFRHAEFPYPLEKVSGQVAVYVSGIDTARPGPPNDIDTDRIILSDFTGLHGKGVVKFKGTQAAVPGTEDSKFTLNVAGTSCPIDDDFKEALTAIKLDPVWTTFSPRGTITFAVDVEILDRAGATPALLPPPFRSQIPPGLRGSLMSRAKPGAPPPFNPATDLTLTLHFTGPSITPDFFPYDLDAVAGRVRYDGTQVRVEKFTAKHGASRWALEAGEVRFYDGGRVWANIGKLDVTPMLIDDEFLKALPPPLSKAFKEVNLKGNAELTLRHLVVLTPESRDTNVMRGSVSMASADAAVDLTTGGKATPQSPLAATDPDPDIYWTGELCLHGASLDAGVAWENVFGRIASTGRYYGTHLGEVVGNLWLDEARAAGHPVQNVKIGYRADPQTPDPYHKGEYEPVALRLENVTGQFFGGTLGGEARVVLSEPVRYRMRLDATDVKLEDFARHHDLTKSSRVEGTAQASLRLETAPGADGKFILDGAGTVDVDRARILNLPFLLPLLKTLKLQAPDKTAFEEAHAAFTIRGDRVHVTHLDLLGDAVSLGGSGETDLDGKYLQFDCYTIWSQTLHRWLTTPVGDFSAFVSEKLFRIEIKRGADGQIKYDARLVPFVTDPVRALAERMKKRKNPVNRDAEAMRSGTR